MYFGNYLYFNLCKNNILAKFVLHVTDSCIGRFPSNYSSCSIFSFSVLFILQLQVNAIFPNLKCNSQSKGCRTISA